MRPKFFLPPKETKKPLNWVDEDDMKPIPWNDIETAGPGSVKP